MRGDSSAGADDKGAGAGRIGRAAAALADAPFRRGFGPLLLVLSIGAQAALYETVLRPIPTIASAYAVSTALGLLNGRGLSIDPEEAKAVRHSTARDEDLRGLYRPGAPRFPAHEPLPGVSLLFAGVALVAGSLRLATIVYLQMILHGLGAWVLAAELRHRSGIAAAVAGLGWALFVPQFRSTLTPGYDSLPALVYIGASVALLRWQRTERLRWLAAAGLACGVGLWLRDYLFVLPLILMPAVAWLRWPRMQTLLPFVAPVALLAIGLAAARSPASGTTHRLIRGGVWHTFWAGVGQFDNELGIVAEDESVRDFAARLAPEANFRVPNYQYLPAYDRVLRESGRDFVAAEWPTLLRNTAYRVGWLLFPSFTPSSQFAEGPMRWLLVVSGVPVSLLALLGFAWLGWRDPFAAWVVAAPVMSLFPLAPYYFVAKVPTGAFMAQLALAGWILGSWVRLPRR